MTTHPLALLRWLAVAVLLACVPACVAHAADGGALADAGEARRSVAAPLASDVERGPLAGTTRTELQEDVGGVVVPTPQPGQPRTGWLAVVAGAIAFILRMVVGLLKQPAVGSPWQRLPQWGQWALLGVATACLAIVDTWLTGASWGTALSEALTGFVGSWGSQKVASFTETNKRIAASNQQIAMASTGGTPLSTPAATT